MSIRALIPLAFFSAIVIGLAIGLTLQPQNIPSALIGSEIPKFSLGPVQKNNLGLKTEDFIGKISVVNIFASWCLPCRVEHPLWMEVSKNENFSLFGINYKDTPINASDWLNEFGNPYSRTGADLNGRVSVEWGVYGVPETFIVDRNGKIQFKHVGPIDRFVLENEILPKIMELKGR